MAVSYIMMSTEDRNLWK